MDKIKPLLTATATAIGGRNGHIRRAMPSSVRTFRYKGDGRSGKTRNCYS